VPTGWKTGLKVKAWRRRAAAGCRIKKSSSGPGPTAAVLVPVPVPVPAKRQHNARDATPITLGVHRNIRLLLGRRRRHRFHRNDGSGYSTTEKRAMARPRHLHLARTYIHPTTFFSGLSLADDRKK